MPAESFAAKVPASLKAHTRFVVAPFAFINPGTLSQTR